MNMVGGTGTGTGMGVGDSSLTSSMELERGSMDNTSSIRVEQEDTLNRASIANIVVNEGHEENEGHINEGQIARNEEMEWATSPLVGDSSDAFGSVVGQERGTSDVAVSDAARVILDTFKETADFFAGIGVLLVSFPVRIHIFSYHFPYIYSLTFFPLS